MFYRLYSGGDPSVHPVLSMAAHRRGSSCPEKMPFLLPDLFHLVS